MGSWSWKSWKRAGGFEIKTAMEVEGPGVNQRPGWHFKASTDVPVNEPCLYANFRRCADGTCVATVDLCPEEQMMNQNTMMIMIMVGMTVVAFLIILYCFQQRSRRQGRTGSTAAMFESVAGDGDNASLNLPPPTYEEVITTNLYPVTPVMARNPRTSQTEEPMTPPPNYDTALHILAQSDEAVFTSAKREESTSPVIRRSVSTDLGPPRNTRSSRSSRSSENEVRRMLSSPEHR